MKAFQQHCLQQMGIEVWQARQTLAAPEQINQTTAVSSDLLTRLDSLKKQVAVCEQCSLHRTRTNTVFGTGNSNADWLIIGEAPGAEEDRQGEPFVGRAGQLLNAMLLAIGLQREQVFIANILKCRPPDNRDPEPTEIASCADYLNSQIDLIKPKIILAVGRFAAQNLLKLETPIGQLRGKHYRYSDQDLPLFVTYHPAYLLRSPTKKSEVWKDLKMAMQFYQTLT